MKDQTSAPLKEALETLRRNKTVPFDVPGHKRGKGNPERRSFRLRCMSVDVNSRNPWTTSPPDGGHRRGGGVGAAPSAQLGPFHGGRDDFSVQAMILPPSKGDKLILRETSTKASSTPSSLRSRSSTSTPRPRNWHCPRYVRGGREGDHGSTSGSEGIFVNNPTYYGICSDLRSIVALAKERGMRVLADEATAPTCTSAKTFPSTLWRRSGYGQRQHAQIRRLLTQSSLLLCGKGSTPITSGRSSTDTETSGSTCCCPAGYLPAKLGLRGVDLFEKVKRYAAYAREEINDIGDYYAYSKELINGDSIYDFDETKLSVNTLGLGLAGIEVYDLLRDEYDIQIEFGDLSNILAYLSVGDKNKDVERLISALLKSIALQETAHRHAPKRVHQPRSGHDLRKPSMRRKRARPGGMCRRNLL